MGFHAPQEMARVLGESIDLSRQAEIRAIALAGGKLPPALPPAPIPAAPPRPGIDPLKAPTVAAVSRLSRGDL